jgi:hypothetical protein
LRANAGVAILGHGMGRTLLKLRASAPTTFFDLSGTKDVELSGVTMDGNQDINAQNGISAHRGGGHFLHHLEIKNLGSTNGPVGIHLTGDAGHYTNGVTDCIVSDNVICNIGVKSEWGGGIRLSWGSSRNQVLRNVVDNTGEEAFLPTTGHPIW